MISAGVDPAAAKERLPASKWALHVSFLGAENTGGS
jgi:hypothetical protein